MKKKLVDLINALEVIDTYNMKDITVNKIAYHSAKVLPGDVFVCVKGLKVDGHKYIKSAIDNGACAIVVQDLQENLEIPQIHVKDTRIALATLGAKYYDYPSNKMKVVGITATNGKTTTSFMLNHIFENYNLTTGLVGTVIIKSGNEIEQSILTTPESLDLQRYFATMVDNKVSHATMEVSSSALDLDRVANVDFDIVSFNNVSREHVDLHGSYENYFNSKASLIRNVGKDKWAVINIDNPELEALTHQTEANIVTFGVDNDSGNIVCRDLDLSTGRAKYTLEILRPFTVGGKTYEKGSFDIKLNVPGYHSVSNSMVAAIIAMICEIPIETIQESMKTFIGVERRFEFIYEDNFLLIDDHFANQANIDATLGTVKYMNHSKFTLVYAIRGNRGVIVNTENARAIAKWAPILGIKEVIATLSKSHVGEKDEVYQDEIDVFNNIMNEANIKVNLFDELPDAIEQAIDNAVSNEIILLSGCQGMDSGAPIALKHIASKNPDIDTSKLFSTIKNRVAGI